MPLKSQIVTFVEDAFAFTVAFVAPISGAAGIVSLFVIIDLCTGIAASMKSGAVRVSWGYRRTIVKWASYMFALTITQAITEYYSVTDVDIIRIVTSAILYTEIKSVDENLEIILGYSPISRVINIIRPRGKT